MESSMQDWNINHLLNLRPTKAHTISGSGFLHFFRDRSPRGPDRHKPKQIIARSRAGRDRKTCLPSLLLSSHHLPVFYSFTLGLHRLLAFRLSYSIRR
ncbi:hypothetical protein N665_0196s0043 [Sinapis alba]|nr:hypothetical protein N665_0196s0043 [Sinapis alba]